MNELVKTLKNFIVRDMIYIVGGVCVIVSFLHLHGYLKKVISKDTNVAVYLFIAGLSYPVGYCIQEVASLIKIVTTGHDFEPGRVRTKLYERYTGSTWSIFSDIKDGDRKKRREKIVKELDKAGRIFQCLDAENSIRTELERIISHMQIGTAIGTCAVVSGLLLLFKAVPDFWKELYLFVQQVPPSYWVFTFIGIIIVTILILLLPTILVVGAVIGALAIITYSTALSFDLSLAYSAILVGVCLTIMGRIKSLQLTKNKENLLYKRFTEYD
jgi:hypothetical protein